MNELKSLAIKSILGFSGIVITTILVLYFLFGQSLINIIFVIILGVMLVLADLYWLREYIFTKSNNVTSEVKRNHG